jgi:hypothetical protein
VPPSSFLRVCHAVADFDAALDLFGGLLSGRTVAEGTSGGFRWVDLAWPGPLGVRLVGTDGDQTAGPVAEWLGGRTGRVHHLALEVTEPSGVPGAAPATSAIARLEGEDGTDVFEIPASDNAGLGLALIAVSDDLGPPPADR